LVGIDVDHASRVANLTNLEAKALPIASLSLASSYAALQARNDDHLVRGSAGPILCRAHPGHCGRPPGHPRRPPGTGQRIRVDGPAGRIVVVR